MTTEQIQELENAGDSRALVLSYLVPYRPDWAGVTIHSYSESEGVATLIITRQNQNGKVWYNPDRLPSRVPLGVAARFDAALVGENVHHAADGSRIDRE